MSPVFWVLMGMGTLAYVALQVLEMREYRKTQAMAERCQRTIETLRHLAELRELAVKEEPRDIGMTIVGPSDAEIADVLIRETAPPRRSLA